MKNHQCPDASIIEQYITGETIEFFFKYLLEANSIEIPKSRYVGRYRGRGT